MKKRVGICVILGILMVTGIVAAIAFTKQNKTDYIKEHSGLELAGKYESVERNLKDSGIALYRYQIKKDAEEEIRHYIQNNWSGGLRGIDHGMIPKDQMYAKTDIEKDLFKDANYVTEYIFMWTPAPGLDGSRAKTAEMDLLIVDKPDGMYIVTIGV